MSDKEMRDMLEFASRFCEQRFAQRGEIASMWHAVTSSGDTFIQLHPVHLGKDMAAALMRALFKRMDVVRYVHIAEAWTVTTTNDNADNAATEAARRGELAKFPGRIEVVMLLAEDCDAGQISAHRQIIRPAHGSPYLAPLQIITQPGDGVVSEGRMIGMLSQRGTRQ